MSSLVIVGSKLFLTKFSTLISHNSSVKELAPDTTKNVTDSKINKEKKNSMFTFPKKKKGMENLFSEGE